MYLASEELEEMAIRPAKRRLKRQMPQGEGHDKASRYVRFYVLEGHLDPAA
jgi:hypothetical protein